MLDCTKETVEVWCVPSATHVRCIHWSKIKILSIRVPIPFYSIPLCIGTLTHHTWPSGCYHLGSPSFRTRSKQFHYRRLSSCGPLRHVVWCVAPPSRSPSSASRLLLPGLLNPVDYSTTVFWKVGKYPANDGVRSLKNSICRNTVVINSKLSILFRLQKSLYRDRSGVIQYWASRIFFNFN